MTIAKIKVLVVDDSAFMRKALKRMLSSDPLIEVVGLAADGEEALRLLQPLSPDVITLDIQMPGMDGLQTLQRIMSAKPTPVLIVSSLTNEGGAVTLRALRAGAVDFIDKSTCHTTMDIVEIADSLIGKVKVIAGVDLKKMAESQRTPVSPDAAPLVAAPPVAAPAPSLERPTHLVAIGTSTGGPMTLELILTRIPADYSGAILVVQHMPVGFTRSLAERMNQLCQLRVKEAEEDDFLRPGVIFIATAGYHLYLQPDRDRFRLNLRRTPRDTMHIPSVDIMMKSVAENWPGPMMGVILTGMGADGAEGVMAMKQKGAYIVAQDEETSVVFGMPKMAALTGAVDRVVPLDQVAFEIIRFK